MTPHVRDGCYQSDRIVGLRFALNNAPRTQRHCALEHPGELFGVFERAFWRYDGPRPTRMAPAQLDEIDVKILRRLQEHARVSNVELADEVGLSPAPCLRRGKTLGTAGVIGETATRRQ